MPLDLNWFYAFPRLEALNLSNMLLRERLPELIKQTQIDTGIKQAQAEQLRMTLDNLVRSLQEQKAFRDSLSNIINEIETAKSKMFAREEDVNFITDRLKDYISNIMQDNNLKAVMSELGIPASPVLKQYGSEASNAIKNALDELLQAQKDIETYKKQSRLSTSNLLSAIRDIPTSNAYDIYVRLLSNLGKSSPTQMLIPKELYSAYGIPEAYSAFPAIKALLDSESGDRAIPVDVVKFGNKRYQVKRTEEVFPDLKELSKDYPHVVLDEEGNFVKLVPERLELERLSMGYGNRELDDLEKLVRNKLNNLKATINTVKSLSGDKKLSIINAIESGNREALLNLLAGNELSPEDKAKVQGAYNDYKKVSDYYHKVLAKRTKFKEYEGEESNNNPVDKLRKLLGK